MITFSQLGSKGRLGNQLFQIASTMGLAKSNFDDKYAFPEWPYRKHFKRGYELPFIDLSNQSYLPVRIKETQFHYNENYKYSFTPSHLNEFDGYLQSYKYFEEIEQVVRDQFEFADELTSKSLSLLPNNGRKNIAIHVRRGDYVGNPSHYNLSIRYYLNALEAFGNWRECNLVFFSDDIEYAKFHFGCLPNSYFPHGSEIEDLCTMSLCDYFIIANSSFSWWGAWLNKNTHNKIVIRPQEHFAGNQLRHDIKDLYPQEWKVVSDNDKPSLLDTTFIIPVKYDHADRKANITLSLKHLTGYFATEVSIIEQGGNKFNYLEPMYDYAQFGGEKFHRTRMINIIAKFVRTPYVVNWDADMLLSPVQIWYSVQQLRAGVDIVYPYDGNWKNLPRQTHPALQNNIDFVIGKAFNGPIESWGGAIFCNRARFLSAGGENENFISWGPEDAERYVRFLKMGLSVERLKGSIFHLEHYRGSDSGRHNPALEANRKEWHMIRLMEPEDLKKYIQTWEWIIK